VVASQTPDCLPGATPVLFGNLRSTYTIVDRQATTVLSNPYARLDTVILFQFELRLGGAVTWPGASRLLRIK